MPDELPPEEEPPDEEPGGMVDDGVSVLVAPPVLLPVPLVPLVPLVSEGMPLEPPDVAPLPLGVLPPELPLVPGAEPPPVMPAQAPSSMAQAMGNIHLVIKHSR